MQTIFPHAAQGTSKRGTLIATAIIVASFLTMGLSAHAQENYYINDEPAPFDVAQMMAAYGMPFGYYWLDARGNWGVKGNTQPLGNIFAGNPAGHRSLSERGLLYSPGELLR